MRSATLLTIGLFSALAFCAAPVPSNDRTPDSQSARAHILPKTMLWAWERPTDISFVTSEVVGVAYLAGTVTLTDHSFMARPRMQPLAFSPESVVMAVVRIESDRSRGRLPSGDALSQLAVEILGLVDRPRVAALQIDFDAAVGERGFYSALLGELRSRMPDDWPLSITALASWCMGDPWIRHLPIDEAVPMLFRMGPDRREVRARLEAGQDFTLKVCRHSVGISTDEWDPAMSHRRRYIFDPGGWTRR
jgi:hypothetical protein